MERVKGLFPDGLPVDPKKQNSEWFQLYREYQDELQVFYSHKAFLLTRDLASLTVIFIPLSIFGHFLLGSPSQMVVYHLWILVILFVGISLSARHYGERFVANVLVEASISEFHSPKIAFGPRNERGILRFSVFQFFLFNSPNAMRVS